MKVQALILWVAGAGCANGIKIPIQRLESPEVRGAFGKGRLDFLGVRSSHALSSSGVENAIASPFFGFEVGVTEKIDASIQMQSQSPLKFSGKYQVVGLPDSKAEAGNISVSVSGSLGMMLSPDSTTTAFGGGVTGGYRVWNWFLPYAGVLLNAASASSVSGTQYGACLGLQMEFEALFIQFELAKAYASSGSAQVDGYYPAALAGLKF